MFFFVSPRDLRAPWADRRETNNTAPLVDSDPPKSTSSEDHISAPRGRCRLKFLHALENDQGFLEHTPMGMGASTIFNNEHSKIGLKFRLCAPITLGLGGATS